MSTDRLDRLEYLFREALLHLPEDRAAFLDAACADDPMLRRELGDLLQADHQAEAEAFLQEPAPGWATHLFEESGDVPNDFMEGRHVGPYVVQRRLGHGGMGDVYLAVREKPFKQYVALKIIRRGMDRREVVARFAVERQILAALNHPNIARLLDGGVTDEGLPYFAMEYVEGRPITVHSDEHRLPLRERLRLFQTVCQTVHYAHQNLIIHRDLKPSNILVTEGGTVKLLDFGIAKFLNPHLSPVAIPVTRTGLRLMTPEYASPEQVCGEPLTTATDVYALGVILYELLTGHRPYQVAGRPTQEIISVVCEQEPERPSTRLTKTETLTRPDGTEMVITPDAVSATRGIPVERLQRQIRGDLDNITLMALRKEPGRRYGSAEQLGQDVGRYLSGMPVVARPNTLGYRLRKFASRHRAAVAASVLIVLSLLGGLGVALWQAIEARYERDRAEAAQIQAEEVAQFLEELFSASDPYAPALERIDTMQVRGFLARGVDRIRTELADQPLVQARMLDVVGRVYSNLALFDEARPLLEQALSTRRGVYGTKHPDVAESLTNRALLFSSTGDLERAQQLLEEALLINIRTLGEEHPTVAVNLNQLGAVLRKQGRFKEAERHHLEALQLLRRTAGERDPRLAVFMNDLVATLEEAGDYHAAEQYGWESVALHRVLYGTAHPQLALALRELGLVLQRLGKYGEAEKLFREAIAIAEETLGEEHPKVADLLNRLASVRWWQKDLAAADSIHRKSLALKRRIYGDMHIEVAYGLNNLASVVRDQGAFDEAESLHREAIQVTSATLGEEHPDYWIVLSNLGKTLWASGHCRRAEPLLQVSIEGMRRTIPRDSLRVPSQQRFLGDCLRVLGRYAEAEAVLLESYAVFRATRGVDDDHTRSAAELLSALYDDWGKPEQAAPYRMLLNQSAVQP